jgi:hypothetical protein
VLGGQLRAVVAMALVRAIHIHFHALAIDVDVLAAHHDVVAWQPDQALM